MTWSGSFPACRNDVDEFVAHSWQDALEHLYSGSWHEHLLRHRTTYAFRGVSCAADGLTTRLARIADDPATVEQHLLRNFRKYAQQRPESRFDSIWHWLALAQHHGLPTRLLDWTYSPLAALHFATEACEPGDAAVWCVDYVAAKPLLPARLQEVLDAESCDVFTPELLADAVTSLEDVGSLASTPALVFLEPPALDQRIVAQYALFSFLTSPDADMEEWMHEHQSMCRCVIVAANAKLEIRDKLDQANVTERVLYPGLDGLCRWLTRYYARRAPVTAE